MRLTFSICLFCVLQSFAIGTFSQNARLSINQKNVSVESVLQLIEDKTDYYFMYSALVVDIKRTVDVEATNKLVPEILEDIFKGTDTSYKIDGRLVALTKNGEISQVTQQQKSISGKVTDSSGASLPGVSVVVKGTTTGSITDSNGNFILANVPGGATLVFSFVGMKTQEITVGNKTAINVTLLEESIGIEEVVAVGYGTMKKSDITGSVSQVKTDVLESVPVYSMEQALKIGSAGVRVVQNSGQPGARVEVRIRGGNSMIGSNEPLYVVDGFPVTGGISFLNPSDIESVDILKDASATAIYGSRGANGVVIITSKRGKEGQKGKIEINSLFGIQQEIKRNEVLDAKQYATIVNERLKNDGQKPFFNVDEVQNPGTNWQDAIFRIAPTQNHTITFSGSSQKTKFSLSGNYYGQDGIIVNSGVKRGSFRLNLDQEMNSWMKLLVNFSASRRERNYVPVDNGNYGQESVLSAAASAAPTLPLYDANGVPTRVDQAYPWGEATMQNPLIYGGLYKDRTLTNSVIGNTSMEIDLGKGLRFKTLLGLEYGTSMRGQFVPLIYASDRGSALSANSCYSSFLNENILSYSKTFNDKNNLNLTGGFTYQTEMTRFSNISVSGFANNATEDYDLSAGETISPPSSGISEWTLLSWLGRANYTFNNKYMFTASIRADGSSRFGNAHKWGMFPSGAFAWRVSEEPFMKNLDFISDLKFRASYGITGNTALSPYQSLDRLSTATYIYGGQTSKIGFVPSGISNSELKWETTAQMDIGLDLAVMSNRLRFTIDYYKKNTTDLLASVPLPPSVGFGSILQNIGEIQNQGFELSVMADILKKEFKWDISAQVSTNRNKVIKLAGNSDIFGDELNLFRSSMNIARVGEPFGSLYGLKEDGLDANGFIKYVDTNKNGVINALDKVIIGNPYPDFVYGLNSNFSYKNFELNLSLEGVSGNDIFWATGGTTLNSFQRGNNQFVDLIGNYWTAENPDPHAKYPKISSKTLVDVSDRFIEDGSYLRLKSLKLAYNLPVKNIGIPWFDDALIYLSGTNLFTITKYPGVDPESNTTGTDSQSVGSRLRVGIDQSAYPAAKIYAVGLKLNF